MKINEDAQLIYVLKIGYNSKKEGQYEFIFSNDKDKIPAQKFEDWGWDLDAAIDNCEPPTEDYADHVLTLKTKAFDLFCLHEATDREYMHGYHNIHALAYEVDRDEEVEDGFNQYESMFEDVGEDEIMLVFHYGMTLKQVKDLFYERKIVLNDNEFLEASSVNIEE